MRDYYNVYVQINCLNIDHKILDPRDFGYIIEDNLLLPERNYELLPPADELIYNCNCKVCSRNSCVVYGYKYLFVDFVFSREIKPVKMFIIMKIRCPKKRNKLIL